VRAGWPGGEDRRDAFSDLGHIGSIECKAISRRRLMHLLKRRLRHSRFGIHCGQYYDQVEVRVGAPKRRERQGDPIHEDDKLFIQSGMTIVVPVWPITELLNLEVFETVRQERENSVADLARDRPQPESIEVPFAQPDD
jgi:hypothetical protein